MNNRRRARIKALKRECRSEMKKGAIFATYLEYQSRINAISIDEYHYNIVIPMNSSGGYLFGRMG